MSETLTANDNALIDEAYTTTYASTFEYLIEHADTQKAKKIIDSIRHNYLEEGGVLE